MHGWNDDVRYALRTLRTGPRFVAAAALMLALGIGATTAIFTVVKRVLIDPLPYPASDRLVKIGHNIGGIDQSYFNDAITLTYTGHSQAFESVGVWSPEGTGVTITGEGDPEEVRALTASRGLLQTLGVPPQIGRWFTAEEDAPGSPNTVIVSNGYWRRRLGGDPNALGRTLNINARPHQVIGIMPAGFEFGGRFDVLLPLRIDAARPVPFFYLNGIARIKPGVTLARANADVARMLEIYFDTFKANTTRSVRWVPMLTPLKEEVIGDAGTTLWILMTAIVIVLLMACANVANLMLVRAEARQHEFAIRHALGAKRSRVARGLLMESLLLAAIGGVFGLALAYGGLRLLVFLEPANLPRLADIAIDPMVIFFAVARTVVSALNLGVVTIAQ
jgi:predicted permease